MGLVPGARARLGDLLVGMLLPSGNDAAVAVAEAVDGTVEQFVAHMDSRGRELGLVSTHFRNAEGLDLPGHVSSAADIARVALLDLNYPRFNAVVRKDRNDSWCRSESRSNCHTQRTSLAPGCHGER